MRVVDYSVLEATGNFPLVRKAEIERELQHTLHAEAHNLPKSVVAVLEQAAQTRKTTLSITQGCFMANVIAKSPDALGLYVAQKLRKKYCALSVDRPVWDIALTYEVRLAR